MSRRHSQMRLTDDIKAHLVYLFVSKLSKYQMCGKALLDGTPVLGANETSPGAMIFMEQAKLMRRVYIFGMSRKLRSRRKRAPLFYYELTEFGMRKLRQFADIEMLKASCAADSL